MRSSRLAPIRHLRDDNVNILFVGRLEKRKGLATFFAPTSS